MKCPLLEKNSPPGGGVLTATQENELAAQPMIWSEKNAIRLLACGPPTVMLVAGGARPTLRATFCRSSAGHQLGSGRTPRQRLGGMALGENVGTRAGPGHAPRWPKTLDLRMRRSATAGRGMISSGMAAAQLHPGEATTWMSCSSASFAEPTEKGR